MYCPKTSILDTAEPQRWGKRGPTFEFVMIWVVELNWYMYMVEQKKSDS